MGMLNDDVGVQLTYQGAMRLPMHIDPLKRQIVFIAHDGENGLYYGADDDLVGKVELVEPVKPVGGDLSQTNIAKDLVAPLAATRGRIDAQIGDPVLTGLVMSNNGRLLVQHGKYYDVGGEPNSGLASVDADLSLDTFEGFYSYDVAKAKVLSGSLFVVPPSWELARSFQFLMGEYWNSSGGGPNMHGVAFDGQLRGSSTPLLSYDYREAHVPDFSFQDRHWSAFPIEVEGGNLHGARRT